MKSMHETSWVVCQALLQRCTSDKKKALLNRLSEEKRKELASLPTPHADPLSKEPPLDIQLERMHSSWIEPFLRTLTENEIRLFLSSLSAVQAHDLQKVLLFTNHLLSLTPLARQFFLEFLWQQAGGDKQIPFSCLPESPLISLFDLNTKNFSQSVFLLGLHDLNQELPQVIETTRLKKIYSSLNPIEEAYLKLLQRKREPVIFKKLALANWDGNVEELRKMIFSRGLNRFAKALYGQNDSLIWYLIHRLDMESAQQCLRLSVALQPLAARTALIRQIEEVVSFLKNRSLGKSSE